MGPPALCCGGRSWQAVSVTSQIRSVGTAKAAALFLLLALLGAACGGDESLDLSDEGARGRSIANENGCAACHGTNGQGGVGPAWQGLYGADVVLEDGKTVVADDAYILRSIREPDADLVEGYTIRMPVNSLTDDDAMAVLAYIRELS